MYAYTIREDLVKDQSKTDTPIHDIALKAVGFKLPELTDGQSLSDEEAVLFWPEKEKFTKKAIDERIYNPEFAYWRKFNHLHGWMEKLYKRKGGIDPNFNCNLVRVEAEDLDVLESLAKAKAFTPTEGFFFGANTAFDDDDRQTVLDFVAKSRAAIANGYAVFYDSWW